MLFDDVVAAVVLLSLRRCTQNIAVIALEFANSNRGSADTCENLK